MPPCLFQDARVKWNTPFGSNAVGTVISAFSKTDSVATVRWVNRRPFKKNYFMIAGLRCVPISEPLYYTQYWPIYPCYSPAKPMVVCLHEYTNDGISVDQECNVARLSLMTVTVHYLAAWK